MVIQKLRDLFRVDTFDPTVDVFPDPDVATLARQTRTEEQSRARGRKDQPTPDATGLDSAEREIIARVRTRRWHVSGKSLRGNVPISAHCVDGISQVRVNCRTSFSHVLS